MAEAPTFTSFLRLPPEIRCKVWAYVSQFPRNVLVWSNHRARLETARSSTQGTPSTYTTHSCTTFCEVPPVLHTSKEVRAEAPKYYFLQLGHLHTGRDGTVLCIPNREYINWDSDTIVPITYDYVSQTLALMGISRYPGLKHLALNIQELSNQRPLPPNEVRFKSECEPSVESILFYSCNYVLDAGDASEKLFSVEFEDIKESIYDPEYAVQEYDAVLNWLETNLDDRLKVPLDRSLNTVKGTRPGGYYEHTNLRDVRIAVRYHGVLW